MKKKGQFNFVWIFAIIAGIAILLLSIYGATKWATTKDFESNTLLAKKLTILTDPMESGFASLSLGTIDFGQEVKIKNLCYLDPEIDGESEYGQNEISVASISKKDNQLTEFGVAVPIKDKYIFSEEIISSEEFYILSQPFEFPYKIADTVVLVPKDKHYCFEQTSDEMIEQIEGFKTKNLHTEKCESLENMTQVCFEQTGCDISIFDRPQNNQEKYTTGILNKNGEQIPFTNNLLLPAIFSDAETYNCNVQRILYRAKKQSEMLIKKSELMNIRDCNTNLKSSLLVWQTNLENATSSKLSYLYEITEQLNQENKNGCRLW